MVNKMDERLDGSMDVDVDVDVNVLGGLRMVIS